MLVSSENSEFIKIQRKLLIQQKKTINLIYDRDSPLSGTFPVSRNYLKAVSRILEETMKKVA